LLNYFTRQFALIFIVVYFDGIFMQYLRLSHFEITFAFEQPWVNSRADIAMFPLCDEEINIGRL